MEATPPENFLVVLTDYGRMHDASGIFMQEKSF
jgi:hypothetical protein